MLATNWIDSEKQKPIDGQKIIVECLAGLYWGKYFNKKEGMVLIEGKSTDIAMWGEVFRWIIYPNG